MQMVSVKERPGSLWWWKSEGGKGKERGVGDSSRVVKSADGWTEIQGLHHQK